MGYFSIMRWSKDSKQWAQAIDHLDKAQAAAPRAGREIADAGRQKDIVKLKTIAEEKLSR